MCKPGGGFVKLGQTRGWEQYIAQSIYEMQKSNELMEANQIDPYLDCN